MARRRRRGRSTVLGATLGLAINPALAADYLCKKEQAVRWIQIESDDPASQLPCRVVFWAAPDSGEELWRARFDRSYCEQRAVELRDKLQADGWRCLADEALLEVRRGVDGGEPSSAGGPLNPEPAPAAGEDEAVDPSAPLQAAPTPPVPPPAQPVAPGVPDSAPVTPVM